METTRWVKFVARNATYPGKWHEVKTGEPNERGWQTWGCGRHEATAVTAEPPPRKDRCLKCIASRRRVEVPPSSPRPKQLTKVRVTLTLPKDAELPLPIPQAFDLVLPRPCSPKALGCALRALQEFVQAMGEVWGVEAGVQIVLDQGKDQ